MNTRSTLAAHIGFFFGVLPSIASAGGKPPREGEAAGDADRLPSPALDDQAELDDREPPPPQRGFGPGGPPIGPDGPWFELSQAQKRELLAFIEEQFPVMARELESLKEQRPEVFNRRLRRIAPDMHRLMDTMRTDPERAQLLIQERKLELRIRLATRRHHLSTDDEEKAALRVELRGLLGEMFDCRRQRRELEIHDLEGRIAELKAELASMKTRRERIIERQLQDHLDRPEPPGRDDAPRRD